MARIISSSDRVIRSKLATKCDIDVLTAHVDLKDVEHVVEAAKSHIPTVLPVYADEAYKKRCAEIQANLAQTLKRKRSL